MEVDMEVALLDKNTLRIKGKKATFIIDPTSKTSGDAIFVLDRTILIEPNNVEEYRVIVSGPGEYEISGSKISVSKKNDKLSYGIAIDNSLLLLTSSTSLVDLADKLEGYEIVLVHADSPLETTAPVPMSSKMMILYGEAASEVAKTFGKEDLVANKKIQFSPEKLPSEMEIAKLG